MSPTFTVVYAVAHVTVGEVVVDCRHEAARQCNLKHADHGRKHQDVE